MNAKLIEGLKLVQEGISLMFESQTKTVAIAKEAPPSKVEPIVEVTVETTPEPVVEVENVPEEVETTANEVTKEFLDEMTYNDLKACAKELGLKAVGKRADITDRVLEYYANGSVEEVKEAPEEEEVAKAPVTITPVAPVEVTKEEEPQQPKDKIYRAVMEITEDMENVDIADTLADIGLSVKGKREALIDRVVQAVRDGLLEVEIDDDDDEPVVGEALEVLEANEANEANEAPEADKVAELEVTDARRKSITEVGEYLDEAFKKGEVSREDLINFITEFFETDETFDDAPDTDLLEMYLQAHSHFIDDDGETHEGGEAYLLGENPACCGRFLEFIEDTGVYVCETCGNEYEAG